MKDTTAELKKVQLAIGRWQTRLVRATNALRKLERKRKRLEAKSLDKSVPKKRNEPTSRTVSKLQSEPEMKTVTKELSEPSPVREPFGKSESSNESVPKDLTIPPFLKREPVDVAKLTAARKAKELVERKRMPLSDRESLRLLRKQQKRTGTQERTR